MTRAQRIKSSTGIYHILLRGINRQLIFEEDADKEQFLSYLVAVRELSGFELYAYCLMGNHVHLLLKEGKEPPGQIIKRLGSRYVFWFNAKYDRSGHLFQDRFKSEPVEDDQYFITVVRYIHQNPAKSGICKKAATYRWSSLRLLGKTGSLVDEEGLRAIIPLDEVRKDADEPIGAELFSEKRGRRLRYTDEGASALMKDVCAVLSASEFQALERGRQMDCIFMLSERRIPIRQQARITGITKGVIERWIKAGRQDK